MGTSNVWGDIQVMPTKELRITLGRDSHTVVDHIWPSIADPTQTALLTMRKTLELLNKLNVETTP